MAKSKLNSTETLESQALIDMEIGHEEFVLTLKERDKYEKNQKKYISEKEENSVNSKKSDEFVSGCKFEQKV